MVYAYVYAYVYGCADSWIRRSLCLCPLLNMSIPIFAPISTPISLPLSTPISTPTSPPLFSDPQDKTGSHPFAKSSGGGPGLCRAGCKGPRFTGAEQRDRDTEFRDTEIQDSSEQEVQAGRQGKRQSRADRGYRRLWMRVKEKGRAGSRVRMLGGKREWCG